MIEHDPSPTLEDLTAPPTPKPWTKPTIKTIGNATELIRSGASPMMQEISTYYPSS